jgi:hypothetical protein
MTETQPQSAGAEEAARAFLDALDGGRFDEAASYVLPSLAAMHHETEVSMTLGIMEQMAERRGGGTFIVSSDGHADPELLRRFGSTPLPGFPGAGTLGEMAGMDPARSMARTLENAVTVSVGPEMPALRYALVGVVMESDTVAHALYRQLRENGRPAFASAYDDAYRVEVLGVRADGGRWYVMPDFMLLSRGSHRMPLMHRLRATLEDGNSDAGDDES